uniref:ShKT domain-containing protein n=1 Tax=Ditylenchus dipsaci TaxID=166011 RepID=A0A915D9H9_9BILA
MNRSRRFRIFYLTIIWLILWNTHCINAQCPVGQKSDGYCGFPKFVCIDPKEKCHSSTCCQVSNTGVPMVQPNGTVTTGSPYCPVNTMPDGYCGFPKFVCVDSQTQCVQSTCCKTNNVAIGNAPASAPYASSVLPPANQPVYSQQPGGYGQPGVYNQQQPNYNNQQPGFTTNSNLTIITSNQECTHSPAIALYKYAVWWGRHWRNTARPKWILSTGVFDDGYCGFPKFVCVDPSEQCIGSNCCQFNSAYKSGNYPLSTNSNQYTGSRLLIQPSNSSPIIPTSYSNPTILLSNNKPYYSPSQVPYYPNQQAPYYPNQQTYYPNQPATPYYPPVQQQSPTTPMLPQHNLITILAPYGYQPAVTYAGYSNTYAVPSYSPYGVPTPTIYPVSPYGGAVVGVPVGSAVSPGTTYVNGVQTIADNRGSSDYSRLQTINGVQYLNGLPVQLVPVVNGVTTNGGSTGVVTLNPATTIGSGVNAGTLINTVPVNTAPVNTGLGTAGTVGNTGSVGNTGTLGTGYNTGTANLVPNTGLAGIAASSCTDASTDCPSYKTYCSLQSIMEACMSTCNMCALSSTIALNG